MQFGISTHLYHDQRLSREHLAQIAGYGFEAVELFAIHEIVPFDVPWCGNLPPRITAAQAGANFSSST